MDFFKDGFSPEQSGAGSRVTLKSPPRRILQSEALSPCSEMRSHSVRKNKYCLEITFN